MRRRPLILALITVASMSCGGPQKGGSGGSGGDGDGSGSALVADGPLSAKQIVDRFKPAIVRVNSDRGVGTGFVVTADGRVATNLHVVAGASKITIELADKRTFVVDRVIAVDPDRDLALLHVNSPTALPTIPLGDSDKMSAGEPIVIIGNPLGVLDFTVSDGLVSSIRAVSPTLTVIQTSAPISQGSSGGPLFNDRGEVIGVATFFSTEGQNLNFAIPSNYLRPMLAVEGGETTAEFAKRFRQRPVAGMLRPTVPQHASTVLDGCTDAQLRDVEAGIKKAIDVGAPVYNRGEHEACFVIYRSAAEGFEKTRSLCSGVRGAFDDGLKRAKTMPGFTEKAWAMRDTFDGLLIAINKKLGASTK